jgi:hypothetical protein
MVHAHRASRNAKRYNTERPLSRRLVTNNVDTRRVLKTKGLVDVETGGKPCGATVANH